MQLGFAAWMDSPAASAGLASDQILSLKDRAEFIRLGAEIDVAATTEEQSLQLRDRYINLLRMRESEWVTPQEINLPHIVTFSHGVTETYRIPPNGWFNDEGLPLLTGQPAPASQRREVRFVLSGKESGQGAEVQ